MHVFSVSHELILVSNVPQYSNVFNIAILDCLQIPVDLTSRFSRQWFVCEAFISYVSFTKIIQKSDKGKHIGFLGSV